jgi:hypothetical protein
MLVRRVVAGMTAIATAVLGLSLATAGPAAAADVGKWQHFGNTNPITSTRSTNTWRCGSSVTVIAGLIAQACVIRSVNNLTIAQSAVIVRNDRPASYEVSATSDLFWSDGSLAGDWVCGRSGVAANSWSVCFGQTGTFGPLSMFADGYLDYGAVFFAHLPDSPPA